MTAPAVQKMRPARFTARTIYENYLAIVTEFENRVKLGEDVTEVATAMREGFEDDLKVITEAGQDDVTWAPVA